ncbi:bifunctional phosphopantothenoylcysteine decarboxylase/phosphopantothenate--cysteine ligase CoaBC [Allosphingosinicella sp.]|uniref:bifunctional phosphopantothenoylcysteine decarboxylase/phosphopantothenate--cysteine ligase CoaBC n=1 Tax=Allosphingosinicella sp. TaxID=2823234 RepID=UPI0037852733
MKKILLIVGGGIAAYKACELIRLCRKAGIGVRCVLTTGGAQFITPMTLAALSEQQVFTSLFDLKDEAEMGHIQLSREADLVVVAPATADLMAKMAAGIADDLATTLLLATDKKVLAAPAMNVRMWQHEATKRNVAQLRADGVTLLEPDEGEMACGEYGPGRLPEPEAILAAIERMLGTADPLAGQPDFAPSAPLTGKHIIVTAGPTHEPIDPVRVIANRSSGKQGFAIAEALAALGARVTLVAGPVSLQTPTGITRRDVETAQEMERAVMAALPADAAVLVAAVADWRVEPAPEKLKKEAGPPALDWQRTPDILAGLATISNRPHLIIGFAAETENVAQEAAAKRLRKGADWIVANDVSGDVMGGDANAVHLITEGGEESWDRMSKADVARRLARKIADALA